MNVTYAAGVHLLPRRIDLCSILILVKKSEPKSKVKKVRRDGGTIRNCEFHLPCSVIHHVIILVLKARCHDFMID